MWCLIQLEIESMNCKLLSNSVVNIWVLVWGISIISYCAVFYPTNGHCSILNSEKFLERIRKNITAPFLNFTFHDSIKKNWMLLLKLVLDHRRLSLGLKLSSSYDIFSECTLLDSNLQTQIWTMIFNRKMILVSN